MPSNVSTTMHPTSEQTTSTSLHLPRVGSAPASTDVTTSASTTTSPAVAPAVSTSSSPSSNPFILPREDVFLMKAKEKEAHLAAKAKLSQMKIWDKPAKLSQLKTDTDNSNGNSNNTTTTGTTTAPQSSYLQRVAARNAFLASSSGPNHLSAHTHNQSASTTLSRLSADHRFYPSQSTGSRHNEKLNMSTFLAQKRDMFLLHMSLTTKRHEIDKLEEKAAMKEEALKKAELMLEEDAMRFDAFLKENDRKAHEALKRADKESKEKNEKIVEIKKLNAEIGKIENEMQKYEEQLNNCMKYKQFLQGLTPAEWLQKEEKRKEEKRTAKKKRQEERRRDAHQKDRAAGLMSHRHGKPKDEEKEFLSVVSSPRRAFPLSPSINTEDDSSSDSDLDEPMYFHSPHQLLSIFSELEERNLFLIQNVQETEENLEEMKQKYGELDREMTEKSRVLTANIAELQAKIEQERDICEGLKRRKEMMGMLGNVSGAEQERLGDGLRAQVRMVYKKCGFDADSQTDTLDMLRDVEGWLEHLLNQMKQMDRSKVDAAEKRKNAERRTMIRQAKKEEQKRLYEERLAKSSARATAEIVRRVGKPVMFRSAPLRKKVKEEDVEEVDEEAEELKRYFT